MSIVVTAATGQLGTHVITSLLERGVPAGKILATGRSQERLAPLAELGVRTAVLDYEQAADGVFSAGDTVLLISSSEVGQRARQHKNVLDAAVNAGVGRLVYTSLAAADTTSIVLGPEHVETEEAIKASGLTYTFLRNGWYTENSVPTFEQAAATGSILSSAGDGLTSSATRADYADAAAVVLTTEGHDNATYELGGDAAWTAADLASVFTDVLGRDIVLHAVDGDKHAEVLGGAGLDEGMIGFLTGIDASTARGDLHVTSGDLSRLIGRPTTSLADTVRTWTK